MVPNPEFDAIQSIFWSMQFAEEYGRQTGMIRVGNENDGIKIQRFCGVAVRVELTETELINALIDLVRELDPDILTGYEVHSNSWGYVIERAGHLNGKFVDSVIKPNSC